MNLTELKALAESLIPETLARLKQAVEINSFRFNPAGIDKTGKLVASWFEPLGFSGEFIQSSTPGAGRHLVLSKEGTSEHHLLYIAHLDTVYPEKETRQSGFTFRREGDRLLGPGVADCKGGIALFRLILEVLKRSVPNLFEQLSCTFALNATEEGGCTDFPEILQAQVSDHTLASIGLEPGREIEDESVESGASGFVTNRKGSRRFVLEVFGREAHSGADHEFGISAIREITRKIDAIEGLTDYGKGITVNVGTVTGGTSVNTVPGFAKAEIDIRFVTEESCSPVIKRLKQICSEPGICSPVDGQYSRLTLSEGPGYPAWPFHPDHQVLFDQIVRFSRELGFELSPLGSGGGSDSAYMADLVPTVDSLGPVGSRFHIMDKEYLYIPSYVERALIHMMIIDSMFTQAGPGQT